jgi:NAD(P)-dependent dehydrogenase (short-subunit alcohol dehydrogenase family)
MKHIAIIGASGAIGNALVYEAIKTYPEAVIHAVSRKKIDDPSVKSYSVDYTSEESLAEVAINASDEGSLDMVIVATGILHDKHIMPEKSLRDISVEKFEHIFKVNTMLPALIAKHFIPQMTRDKKTIFAALSARVGSISDNNLGGWYAYRASKAALNMILKNIALETSRKNKHSIVVGLHPGTVNSDLSKPFQTHIKEGKLFTPTHSAACLLNVLQNLTPHDTGKCFAYNGQEILP